MRASACARLAWPAAIAVGTAMLCLFGGCQPQQQTAQQSPPAATKESPLEPLPLPSEVKGGAARKVAMIPKRKGMAYFNAAEKGAQQAAQDLNVELLYEGPEQADDVNKQIEIIESFIVQKVDAICISANDPSTVAPALRKARDNGIHVLTWDADADPQASGREFMVDQASPEMIGRTLVDVMAEEAGSAAQCCIISGSATAANQNEWMKWMREEIKSKYPKMQILAVKPSEEDQQRARQVTEDVLRAYPELKGIFAITSVAFPGAAAALEKSDRKGKVALTGLSSPKTMRGWVESGTVKTVVLWNAVDLGYLTIVAARGLCDGTLKPGATSLSAGRLGTKTVDGQRVVLGDPMLFTKDNIGQFDF